MKNRNNSLEAMNTLFKIMGIQDWDAYRTAIGNVGCYLSYVKAIHISQASGIGFNLPNGPEFDIWGGKGTGKGLLNNKDFHFFFNFARVNNVPISIEEVYDTRNLTYREADTFLEPLFESYRPGTDLDDLIR